MDTDGFLIPSFKAGTFVWSSAPAVSRTVIEDLMQARQKRTQLAHVLGYTRLLYSDWRRNIYKYADLIIEIPVGCG